MGGCAEFANFTNQISVLHGLKQEHRNKSQPVRVCRLYSIIWHELQGLETSNGGLTNTDL